MLVAWAGYPASMVGVPGEGMSNLDPPTLAVVTFGLAQCGLALLLRERLRHAMRRPVAWAAVALVNLSAMTIFLWHQTALMATTATGLLAGRLPGLHTRPDGLDWVGARLLWLPGVRAGPRGLLGRLPLLRAGRRAGGRRGRRSRVVRTHRPSDRGTAARARHV